MSKHKRFHLRDLDLLRRELEELGLQLPIDSDVSILGEPVSIGPHTTPNRFIVQPMEGFDSTADGSPGPLSFRRYRRYAEGGTGFIWLEATAVMPEARSNPRQLLIHEGNVENYRRLVEATRQAARERFGHDLVMVIQLTHSGRYCKPTGVPRPIIAHRSAILDPKHNLPDDYPLVTDAYLDRLQDTYVVAAKLAAQAGFDGIDIKSCHRYLVSELLASHTREGKYGGSLENRSRLLRETFERITEEVPEVFITTRMNVYDAISYPYGFGVDRDDYRKPDLREPIELIRQIHKLGAPVLNMSIGNPYYNPHFGRPYDRPIVGMDPPEEHPLAAIVRFVSITRAVQESVPELPIVASGYSWLRHLIPHVAAGVIRTKGATLLGQGRNSFAYPESVHDVLSTGRMDPAKTCIACSACTQIMRDGTMTGCVVRDNKIYGQQYKLGRRFSLDRLQEKAKQCLDCEFATCTANCPAHVDVPAFVHAFAEGDIKTAYEVLRANNVLPEMCAHICPAEVQCEGGCLENIFDDCAIPIRDIQLVTCQIARREKLVGVRLPETCSGKRVAVVGGGPASLACAIALLEKGHTVTLWEKDDRLGGTPDSIIPDERYHEAGEEIDAILEPALLAQRLKLKLGCALGRDVSLEELRNQFDAVFLGLGLGHSISLGKAKGVWDALTFLRQVKCGKITSLGNKVAVLGGGNTAMDAAVTAMNLGTEDVFVVYRRSFAEMPAWPEERQNMVDAGCHLMVLTQPLGYEVDDQQQLVGLRIARTELGEPDESGRRRPMPVPQSESLLAVDAVIEAIGQGISEELQKSLVGIEFTSARLVATQNDSQSTSLPGLFAGGDLVNGGTTAVQGIAEGMRAAVEIDTWIRAEHP